MKLSVRAQKGQRKEMGLSDTAWCEIQVEVQQEASSPSSCCGSESCFKLFQIILLTPKTQPTHYEVSYLLSTPHNNNHFHLY